MRTVNAGELPEETNIEAAKKLGLLNSDDLWISTMQDAVDQNMNARALIRYFARMLYNQPPEDSKAMLDLFLDELIPQPPNGQDPNVSRTQRQERLLQQLEYLFRLFGTKCKEMGLPPPKKYDHKKMAEQMDEDELVNLVGGDDSGKPKQSWEYLVKQRVKMMNDNPDQLAAYEEILNSINDPSKNIQKLFFLEGKYFLF